MTEYAIEADPGKRTASFPTFDTFDAALAAASQPAMEREGLPLPRVLVRTSGGAWSATCRHCGHPTKDGAHSECNRCAAAEWGEECATCGVNVRREDDLFCSDECAGNDWLSQPDPNEQYDREGLFGA